MENWYRGKAFIMKLFSEGVSFLEQSKNVAVHCYIFFFAGSLFLVISQPLILIGLIQFFISMFCSLCSKRSHRRIVPLVCIIVVLGLYFCDWVVIL